MGGAIMKILWKLPQKQMISFENLSVLIYH